MGEDFESYKAFEELEDGLYLEHYGTPRHSGRYPWGSGKNPYQHDSADWLARVDQLRSRKNMDDRQIAKEMGCTINQLRAWESVAKNERKNANITWCKNLAKEGKSIAEIEKITGIKDRTIRNYLTSDKDVKPLQAQATAQFLKEQIKNKKYIDVGKGTEKDVMSVDGELGITANKMREALEILRRDGYDVMNLKIPQATNPGQQTTRVVAAKFPEGMTDKEKYRELFLARDAGEIQSINEYHSDDAGLTWNAPKPPVSIDSKRVKVVYAEEGGIDKDGVIEIRRGVPDLSLGNSHYAQVRIAVDGTHYLKGMAVYKDGKDMPDGVDILFNTNKHSDKKMIDGDNGVLKPMKEDPTHKGQIDQTNPFGAVIMRNGQSDYDDPVTGEKKQSAINKIRQQGDWEEYSKDIPSQFLSKQNPDLIKKQLNYSIQDIRSEFSEIMAINNPTIRQYYLKKFAEGCDSRAVELKASAFPRQKYQVILPSTTLKNTEVYAPNYRDGEQLALIRFPHGSKAEIPILTVNNKNRECINMIGKDVTDAVCITKENADRLSGADFDGDTVIAIPTGRGNKVKITNEDPLKGLVGFDAKEEYGTQAVKDESGKTVYINKNGVKITPLNERNTQIEMGKITNLITDMTVAGASTDDIAKAIRHSQTVIDAKKHHLDWKTSEIENDIASLKQMYQRRYDEDGNLHIGGASTLLSRSTNEKPYPETRGQIHYNQIGKPWYDKDLPEGALILKESGRTYEETKPVKDADGNVMYYEDTGKPIKVKTGKVKLATVDRPQMAMTNDARTLVSAIHSEPELLYAEYANQLKQLANDARKTMIYTKPIQYNPTARKEYADAVKSLKAKLDQAYRAKPKEARAQNIALGIINEKIKADPNLSQKDIKKIRQIAIETARAQVGVNRKDKEITLSDREWAAIQSGAISNHILTEILNNTNPDSLRERATPSNGRLLSESQEAKIRNMHNGYYTIAEIADAMGVSTSTVSRVLKGD